MRKLYALADIHRLLWPANAPDLNAIEPAWWWMKRRTTSRGAPATKKKLERSWVKAWKELPQSQIQRWIERIPKHLQRIIDCEGGMSLKREIKGNGLERVGG